MIDNYLLNAKTVAIFGHVRPDGDCAGSTLALFNYIKDNFPQIDVKVYLENFPESYGIMRGANLTLPHYTVSDFFTPVCDVAFLLDTPSFDRVGANGEECIKRAKFTCNIDHHISNPLNLCNENFVVPESSSASEVLFSLFDRNKISVDTASCLYLGIVHDTGAFKYSSTSKATMNVIGELIGKGIDFARIVNETYYTRTYKQTLVTGFVMQKSELGLDGKVVYSYITNEEMKKFGVTPIDLSNVIDSLREVSGTEVAVFLYPVNGKYKISLRSNYQVDVNAIAKHFGGGGHIRAAGADTNLTIEFTIQKILLLVESQL